MNAKTPTRNEQDLLKSLQLIVGERYVITDLSAMTPFLEESRGREVGTAYCVVQPENSDEVSRIVKLCRYLKVPIVIQGGNTGRCLGAFSDATENVILSLKRLNKIRDCDPTNHTITVEAGCVLANIQSEVAKYDLFFPLSLGAEGSCQIGGNLATNAGGINVLRYGNTRDLVLGIEAVMPNGHVLNELYALRKNNTGYDLKNLLIGSEGTLAVITACVLKLFPPEHEVSNAFIGVNSVSDALTTLRDLQHRFSGKVSTFELISNDCIRYLEKHSDVRCPITNNHPYYVWYRLAESHSATNLDELNAEFLAEKIEAEQIIDATLAQNISQAKVFATIREQIVEIQKLIGSAVKFDISVPVSKVEQFIDTANQRVQTVCKGARPFAFGHLGDGNIHYNVIQPENSTAEDYLTYQVAMIDSIHELVDALDGSFSAEHGVGRIKVSDMKKYKDPVALDTMRRIKHALDPMNILNPGKVLPPSED